MSRSKKNPFENGFSFVSPWQQFEQMQRAAAQLANGYAIRRVTSALSQEARTQVIKGFRASRSPYGTPWKDLKLRRGQPLRKTGRLQNSFTVGVDSASSFVVGTNVFYANTHQYGATIRPKRGKFLAFQASIPTFSFKTGKVRKRTKWIFAKEVHIPARPMVPDTEADFLPIWGKAFERVAKSTINEIVEKA